MTKREYCPKCNRPKPSCYCDSITNYSCKSKILIIRDITEAKHPFNTALMAKLSLKDNVTILDTTSTNFEFKIFDFIKNNSPFLLFKNIDSKPLQKSVKQSEVLNFIVLDGTWSKAKKIYFKYSCLHDIPIYHLEVKSESIYKDIRKSCSEKHLSTLEAIKEVIEYIDDKNYEELLNPLKEVLKEQKKWAQKDPKIIY